MLIDISGKEIRIDGRLVRIACLEGDGYLFIDNPEAVLDGLRKSEERIDLFTFTQKLSDTSPKFAYPMEWDNMAVLSLSTYDNWWNCQINDKTRNMTRRAEKKGVSTREVPFDDTLVRGIFAIYNESVVRQGKPNAHYGKDLDTVRKISGTFLCQSFFIGAFLEGNLIGFAKLTCDEGKGQASLMHIVSMIGHRDKAPTNALIAQAVRSCAVRKIPYLVYAKFAYGKKQRDSLSDFKKHNGFRRRDFPRYYVPLTLAGLIAHRLGLHHRLIYYIPEPIQAPLRKVRSIWNIWRLKVNRRTV
jgi:hypothetical protein